MSQDVLLADSAWEGVEADVHALLDAWLVQPGAPVTAGQTLARVVLVKSTIDVPAPVSGHLAERLVNEGDTFARGQAIARIAAQTP